MQCRELDIFKIFFGNFLDCLGKLFGNFFEGSFGRIFWEISFGSSFWGVIFWRNYLVEINKGLMFLSRFWGYFVSMHRKKEEEF